MIASYGLEQTIKGVSLAYTQADQVKILARLDVAGLDWN